MRPIKVSLLVLVLCFGLATMAWSMTILVDDKYDVGSVDKFLWATNKLAPCGPGGSPAAETCWANSKLLPDDEVFFQVKDEPVAYFATNKTDVYAFKMDPLPSEYFLIKNARWWALFENLDDLAWGVFDVTHLPSGIKLGGSHDFEISHVTRFNPVPEPGTILLLGAGLFGLVAVSRRKFRK